MRYSSRKFLLAVAVLCSATYLVLVQGITAVAYSTTVLGTAGAYIAGNVYQKVNTAP